MSVLLGAVLGALASFVLAVPAILLEASRRLSNAPLLLDVHIWRGRKISDGEAFALGLLIHIGIGFVYGLTYAIFARFNLPIGSFGPYSLISMTVFAVALWMVLMMVVCPLVGFGFLGRKEGKTVWLEILMSLLAEAALLWLLTTFYWPSYFAV